MATMATGNGMFTPTRDLPLWINRTKVGTVSEMDSNHRPLTVKTEQPVVLPLPAGGSYTLPPGGVIVGKYFENCRGWKSVSPLFIPVERSKIHDPLNLLSTTSAPEEDPGWKSATATGDALVYGKTLDQWRTYFKSAKPEQVSQEYGSRKKLGRIAEFCGVTIDTNGQFVEWVGALRTWAMAK